MARDGKPTRDKILSESRALILKNGYSGTSIDNILEKTGITKGAFFYHFKTKNLLAKALLEDFAKEDIFYMNEALEKTEPLKGDALQRLLQFIQEFIDMISDLSEPPPGCLYATYLSENNQFDKEIWEFISTTILLWRSTLEMLIHNVLEENKIKIEVDVASLADLLVVIFEGSYVISKAVNEADLTAKQLTHLKNYFQLLFDAKR
jgi:TetR/AcrR family transcriptional repressor of nem operon